jgi:outer membrane protein assembly factor BamB
MVENGNEVYAYIQSDGTQVWVYTRNGVIQNGGVNIIQNPKYL